MTNQYDDDDEELQMAIALSMSLSDKELSTETTETKSSKVNKKDVLKRKILDEKKQKLCLVIQVAERQTGLWSKGKKDEANKKFGQELFDFLFSLGSPFSNKVFGSKDPYNIYSVIMEKVHRCIDDEHSLLGKVNPAMEKLHKELHRVKECYSKELMDIKHLYLDKMDQFRVESIASITGKCEEALAELEKKENKVEKEDFKTVKTEKDEKCSICQDVFEKDDEVVALNHLDCKHAHHKECLINWFKQKKTCPICQKTTS